MSPFLIRAVLAAFWSVGLYGTLRIHELNLSLGHSICGPWGCGPLTEALIGYHAFWFVLFLPLGLIAAAFFAPTARRRLGTTILLLGAIGSVGYMAWDAWGYYQQVGTTNLLIQRALFALATAIDFPTVQFGVMGFVLMRSPRTQTVKSSPFAESTTVVSQST